MNWADLAVIAIITGFGIIGLRKGFIYSMYRLVSFFASVFISVKFYPMVSKILMMTGIYPSIKASIYKSLLLQQQVQSPGVDAQIKQSAADTVVKELGLPDFLKDSILNQMPDPSKIVDMTKILDGISGELAKMVINIISLIIVYIVVRFALLFLRFILEGIAKLPVFKQVNKVGGFAFGAVEGLLTIYIICAFLMLFSTSAQFKPVFDSINTSTVAQGFYQNNFIVDWMFPSKDNKV